MVRRYFTQEETDISSSTLTSRENRDYSDIDLTFTTKPGPAGVPTTGDVYKKTGAAAVKQAVKTLLLTGQFEKPFQPNFGAGLHDVVFEYNDVAERDLIAARIENAIKYFEPRATLEDIAISDELNNNSIQIAVLFSINNTQEVVEFTTTLNRLR